jgi:hypothetical protein
MQNLKFYNFQSPPIDDGIGSSIALNGCKMAPKDARRIPGTLVEIRAVTFMPLAGCARRFRSKKTTKLLHGGILACQKTFTSSGKTSQSLVTIEVQLDSGEKKIITTGLRNVKAVIVENLAMNQGGCTSTGSTQFGAPDPQDADGDPQEAPGPNCCYQGSSIPISGTIVTGELADSSNGGGEKNHRSTNMTKMSTVTGAMDTPPPPPEGPDPAIAVQGTAWFDDDAATELPINGYPSPSSRRSCSCRCCSWHGLV